jgi:hypothetical protein
MPVRSFRVTVLLLLAAILVVGPFVLTLPIAGSGGDGSGLTPSSVCAFCAVTAPQITLAPRIITAPAVIVDRLIAVSPDRHSFDTPLPLASRAPPAA